jgi:hypothetical protein
MNNIQAGDPVRVQICVGRYGQTEVLRGELQKMRHDGVVINLAHDYKEDMGSRFGVITRKKGTNYMAHCQTRECKYHHVHHDYEHGHETWVVKDLQLITQRRIDEAIV